MRSLEERDFLCFILAKGVEVELERGRLMAMYECLYPSCLYQVYLVLKGKNFKNCILEKVVENQILFNRLVKDW